MSTHNFSRFHKLLIAAAVIGFILLAALYLLRSVLIAPHIRKVLEDTLASHLGVRLTIGHIRGSYITDFEVANVTTLKPAPVGRLVDLELKRLKLSYNPLSILKGLDAFWGAATVEVEGAKLEFDLSPQHRISAPPSEKGLSESFFLPGQLPRFRVENASVILRGPDYGTAFKGIGLKTQDFRQTNRAILLHVQEWSWTHPDLQDGNSAVTAVIDYSKERITVRRMRLGERELGESVQIGLKSLPETVSFDARLNLFGGEVALDGKLGPAELHAKVHVARLDLARLLVSLSPKKRPIAGTLSMQGDIILPWEQPMDLAVNLDLTLTRGAIHGLAADELVLSGTIRDRELLLAGLNLHSGANRFEIHELRGPVETVFRGDLAGVAETFAGKFSLDCQDIPSLFFQAKTGFPSTAEPIPAHRLLLNGELNHGNVILAGGSLTADSGHIRLEPSRISLPAKSRPLKDAPIQAGFDINFPNLGLLSRIFAMPQLGGSLRGKATVTGTLGAPRGTAVVVAEAISFKDTNFGDATAQLWSNGQKVTVETLEVRQSNDRIHLRGSVDLTSRSFEEVGMQVAVADIAAYTKNLFANEQPLTGSIRGSLKINGSIEEPDGQVDVGLEHVQLSGVHIPRAKLKARSSGRRITIDLAEASTPLGEARLTGQLLRGPEDAHGDLEISTLTLSGQGAELALQAPGHIRFSRDGELVFKNIALSGPTGRISLMGALAAHGNIDLHLVVSGMSSDGGLESFLGTDGLLFSGLDAQIHLFGPMDSPSLTITGDLATISRHGRKTSLSGRFDLSYARERLAIRRFEWTGREGQQLSITGVLPVNLGGKTALGTGPLTLDAKVNLPDLSAVDFILPNYIPSAGSLQGELHLTGSWNAPSGTIVFHGRELSQPLPFKPMPPGPLSVVGDIRFDGERVVVESIQIDSPLLTFTSQGHWTGKSLLADLLEGLPGKLEGDVALKGNLEVTDLSWIAGEISGLRRVSGRLEAEVTMEGAVSNPALYGTIRLSDGELRLDADVPSLHAMNVEAALTPATAQLQTFTAELGGARFQVSGSVVRNGESGSTTDLRLYGENLLLYRSEGVKLRADTDLTIKGPISRLEVTGEVAITDGRFVKYFDFLSAMRGSATPSAEHGLQLFSIRNRPLSNVVLDLSITSKHPFRIRNNLANGSLRPDLKLTGTGEMPVLTGKIYVEPTRLNLPAGSLMIDSGVIRLDPNSPDRPTLDLVGKSRMLGYDITVLVEGVYDEPVVTLSSVPPLSNEELLLLVLTGQQPGAKDDRAASERQTMTVAAYIGRDFISRWFGSESVESRESILDRFEVEVGRAMTRGGEETLDAQFRLTEGIISDGDMLYLTAEKDVFDFYNAGVKIVFRFK